MCDSNLQTTLALIKPDAMIFRKKILKRILNAGFDILSKRTTKLSPEQAANFYEDYNEEKYFMLLVLCLSENPIEVMILSKVDAIESWKKLMGPDKPTDAIVVCPTSLRALFGSYIYPLRNAVHGSCNELNARKEIHFFFPNFFVEPLCEIKSNRFCCSTPLVTVMMKGLFELNKERPQDPVFWLGVWLLEHNPLKPITQQSEYTCKL